jgi:P-type E1-E2 ATPase
VPRDVREAPGQGVTGGVDGRRVSVGSRSFIVGELSAPDPAARQVPAALRAFVAVDGVVAGVIEYSDRPRAGARALLARLATLGVTRTILLSGDDEANALATARDVGITEARGDLLPADKVAAVTALSETGRKVLMVGDGTNDAPALRTADVGIALAGHGGGISAEAADVVILNDDLARVGDAVAIGQRTMRIARQSIWVGLSLSALAMVIAALGYIPAVVGALLQEGIDVAVILNALRATWMPLAAPAPLSLATSGPS